MEDTSYVLSRTDFGFSDPLDNHDFSAVTISQLPANGLLTLDGVPVSSGQQISIIDIDANALQFSPQPNINGLAYDSFGFQVHDDGGNASGGSFIDPQQRTITFNIDNVNDAPSGADNTVSTPEDTDYIFNRVDFGFTDPLDNDAFRSIIITSLPNSGILTNNGLALTQGDRVEVTDIDNGQFIYTPPLNDTGVAYNGFGYLCQALTP